MITKRVLSILFFSLFSIILFGQNLETVKNDKPIIENKGVLFYSLSDTCQPFTININASLSSHNIDNSFHINVCPGDTVSFTAEAIFNQNNPNYNQTLTNTKFIWQFAFCTDKILPLNLFLKKFQHNRIWIVRRSRENFHGIDRNRIFPQSIVSSNCFNSC